MFPSETKGLKNFEKYNPTNTLNVFRVEDDRKRNKTSICFKRHFRACRLSNSFIENRCKKQNISCYSLACKIHRQIHEVLRSKQRIITSHVLAYKV